METEVIDPRQRLVFKEQGSTLGSPAKLPKYAPVTQPGMQTFPEIDILDLDRLEENVTEPSGKEKRDTNNEEHDEFWAIQEAEFQSKLKDLAEKEKVDNLGNMKSSGNPLKEQCLYISEDELLDNEDDELIVEQDSIGGKNMSAKNVEEEKAEKGKQSVEEIGVSGNDERLQNVKGKEHERANTRKIDNQSKGEQKRATKKQKVKANAEPKNKGNRVPVEDEIEDEDRFRDSDYEQDDDEDLDALAMSREHQWNEVLTQLGQTGKSSENVEEDEDSDGSWEEPGDEMSQEEWMSQSSSDSEQENWSKPKLRVHKRFVKPKDNEDVVFEVGHEFLSKKEFQYACRHHGVIAHRRIKFIRNNANRCTARCKTSQKCTWIVSANYRAIRKSWEITLVQFTHNCTPTFNHSCCTYKYLSERYKADIQIMPHMRISELQQKAQHDLRITISRSKAFKAKQTALKEILGDYKKQYTMIKDYSNELLRSNPNSTVIVQTENDDFGNKLFRRMYVCFDACKKGFVEGCRPVIGLDGCHLFGPHKGILLAAIGVDANDQIFPVAYAVVEIENKSTWLWFLSNLIHDLNIKNAPEWTLISDKQKGLGSAITTLLPNVEHRLCTWHMYRNFKDSYASLELKEMVWAAAKCTHKNQFEAQMDRIKRTEPGAYAWLVKRTKFSDWSRAHFNTGSKCDILVNNIVECFNKVILHARGQPLLTMFEALRFYFMDRHHQKRVFIERMKGELGPKVRKKLDKNMRDSNRCFARPAGDLEFQVKCGFGELYAVNLKTRTCGCRKWDLTGIPCSHAIAAISLVKEEPEAFMNNCYSKKAYERAYKYIIHPINGPDLWDRTDQRDMLPPVEISIGGRPPKCRKKSADEKKGQSKNSKNALKRLSRVGMMRTYTCSLCKQTGHTQKRCPTKVASSSRPPTQPSPLHAQPSPPPVQPSQPYTVLAQPSNINAPAPKKVKEKKPRCCSICNQTGHYKPKCTSPLAACYQPHVEYVENH